MVCFKQTFFKCPKSKIFFFHKYSKIDKIPLMLSKLAINNHLTGRQKFIKFLGVLLDELERSHLIYREQNCKNLELLYRAGLFFDRNSLPALYYMFVYTYINYSNIAWATTCRKKL